jgi:hypothetical protein
LFVRTGFALAGTAEQVIAQAAQYRRAGADELALSFAGPQPAADAAYFARAVNRPFSGTRGASQSPSREATGDCARAVPVVEEAGRYTILDILL